MEMNTRLQVEHPVTEEITGEDLVEWQLRVASGEKLPLKQEELKINGHAIEARLYAENPETGFLPSTGRLQEFWPPREGARLDTGLDGGDEITPYYDPMLAKVICHAASRSEAIRRLRDAVAHIKIWPVKSNAGFLFRCLSNESFEAGEVDTSLIERAGASLTNAPAPSAEAVSAAAKAFTSLPIVIPGGRVFRGPGWDYSPWRELAGFRLNGQAETAVRLLNNGRSIVGQVKPKSDWHGSLTHDKTRALVVENGETYEFTLDTGEVEGGEAAAGDGAILSPMPGKIVSVAAKAGAKLKKGDPILVLEAMKMEHTLVAPFDGKLAELNAKPGAQVSEGVLLAKMVSE
jgi:acetyl/propionyl-CoA carboxylase alpha subunit